MTQLVGEHLRGGGVNTEEGWVYRDGDWQTGRRGVGYRENGGSRGAVKGLGEGCS